MKRYILFYTPLIILLFFSCQKENVDEVVIEEFIFEADSLIEKGGLVIMKEDNIELLNHDGFSFRCEGFHGDTVFYYLSTHFFRVPNDPISPELPPTLVITWFEINGQTQISQLIFTDSLSKTTPFTPINNQSNIQIIEQSNQFINGQFSGQFVNEYSAESLSFNFSGEFGVPIYQNCETAPPIGIGNMTINLPFVVARKVDAKLVSCQKRHLISTLPNASLEQYDQSPLSLLQNENDFYIYLEGEIDVSERFNSLLVRDAKIKAKLFEQIQIYSFESIYADDSNYWMPIKISESDQIIGGSFAKIEVLEDKDIFKLISIITQEDGIPWEKGDCE